jgi:nicotinamide mononucleotide transporter
MLEIWEGIVSYASQIDLLEFLGLVFGLLTVYFLIKEKIINFACGITYVLISFVIFWQQRLYGDLILHLFFLVLNIYGWYYWIAGRRKDEEELPVSRTGRPMMVRILVISAIGILVFGYFLANIHLIWPNLDKAAVPYWDSATSILSVTGMWLTARKKIENWHFWLIVDVLATGIYIYKGIYFYATLYGIYIFLAIAGYLTWKKSMGTASGTTIMQ